MKTRLHVGNLSSRVTETNLQYLFSQMGEISEIKLVIERSTGRSRAFALVTMATPEGAEAALHALHRHSLNGRYITVNAWPKEEDDSFPKGRIAFSPDEPSILQSEGSPPAEADK